MKVDGYYQPDYGPTHIGNRFVRLHSPEQEANAKVASVEAQRNRTRNVFDPARAMSGLLAIFDDVYGDDAA